MSAIQSLIDAGTKLYLDSVDPEEITKNLAWGAVGATSNPAIISEIIARGALDSRIESLLDEGKTDEEIAWALTDHLVSEAERRFLSGWMETNGNAGWVSFELDPLLEDPAMGFSDAERTARYIELGKFWSDGHSNRMIKVPATPAGIAALEGLAAAGVPLNVTLIFTSDQYRQAREAIWRGAQQLDLMTDFKSVYSIFVSRIDVYTAAEVPQLSAAAQGQVGIVNAKQIWAENTEFWADKPTRLQQEIIFASTGTKDPNEPPWKYVAALAGADIQTNPPQTNQAVADSDLQFDKQVDRLPPAEVLAEIHEKVDVAAMHEQLMAEGVDKFVKPQRALLDSIKEKRRVLASS
ncbi:transaldolase family protein [Planctomycetaceae bacterium SH139]